MASLRSAEGRWRVRTEVVQHQHDALRRRVAHVQFHHGVRVLRSRPTRHAFWRAPPAGGDHYLAVNASGAWQIGVEQPVPENVSPVQQTSFLSQGQDVTPCFMLPDGIQQIALQAPASSALLAYL